MSVTINTYFLSIKIKMFNNIISLILKYLFFIKIKLSFNGSRYKTKCYH